MRLRFLIIAFLCLTPTLALANACTYSGASGNFRTVAWVSCGGTYPQGADTAAISGANVVVTIPLAETDSIGTTGGTTPHPVLTVSGSAGLVILGTLTVGNQSGVQTNDIKVTGSGSFILNSGTFSQQGDLDLDTSAEFDACAGGVHAVVSSGTTILNRITGTGTAVPYPLWNMHSTRCALYGGAIPSSPVGTPCTDAGGGANCYHMQVPSGTAFQWGHFGDYLVFDANSLVFDSPNSTYGTCGKSNALCFQGQGMWCRNTSFNYTGELAYQPSGSANDPGLDWSADVYGQGCEIRNPLGTGAGNIGLYCSATFPPGTYQGHPSPRRIEWATFDVDAGEHNYGYIYSVCPNLDVNNVVSGAEFLAAAGGTQLNVNYHDVLFLRAYNFVDSVNMGNFMAGAGVTYTNIGALEQGPKPLAAHAHLIIDGGVSGPNFGQNYTACNTYKNLFFEASGDTISHDNMFVNSTCTRMQGGIFDHNFTNFVDNNNPSAQCMSCNASGAEHVTIVDNNNSADPTSTGYEPWEVQAVGDRLGVDKIDEINSFLAQSVTSVIGHSSLAYTNNTANRWTEQPAYGSANITSVVVTNPNVTINVDSSTPFQSTTHGQVALISVLGTAGGINESPGNCTAGAILRINSGNNDATFQNTSAVDGPISSYAIVAPGTGYIANRNGVTYTTTVVGGTCTSSCSCSIAPVVSVATGDVLARLGCTMQTGYGIQSTAATVLNCHHFFVTSTTPTSVTGAIPPGVTLADGTYTTTGIIEKGFNYDYNVGGDWQTKALCGTPNLWNTAAGGIDGVPFGDANISAFCNWIALGTFSAASTCNSPCTSLSANAVTGHPFAVNQVVIDRTSAGTTTALITAVSGSGPYTLTLGPNNQTGVAGLPFTVNTTDTLVLVQGIWDSTAPAFGTATHYGSHDVSASPQLAYSSFTAGKITGITSTPITGGSGYVQGTVYFLSGGTDPGAITATSVTGGVINAATLAYGGSGYSSGQILTVQGGGNNATVQTTGVQASCNLATWDKSLGGVGSWANAKKMLLAMNGHDQADNTVALNPEYNLQNYFAYKAECYKFYNTALNGKGAQGTDPGFAPNSVDPSIGKITDNYILPGSTHTVNGAGENIFTNQAGQVHIGGHGQLTLSSAPRICADALDPCTALTTPPVVLAGQYYHFTANGPAAITWSVSGDTNSSITPQTGVYTRTGTPTGTITVTATNLNGSSSITVSPSGTQTQPVITSDTIPPGVPMGGTHTFTASGGSIVWSVTGAGSINSSTGVYTPPTGVLPQDYSRGWQLLTNNSGWTTRIDTLPLAGRSAWWMSQWRGYNPVNPSLQHSTTWTFMPFGFFDNVIDNSELTRTVLNKEYYIDVFDHSTYVPPDQPWIQRADRFAQTGWSYRNGDGADHHVFRINKDTGIMYEGYQRYADMSGFTWTAGNPTLVSFTSSRGAVDIPATPQNVWVSGGTGCWAAVNAVSPGILAQVIDGQHYALPVDTSACGLANTGIIMCSVPGAGTTCIANNTDINTQGSDIFHPYSNYIGWGADLGRSSISATSIHMQELYAAVVRCRAASNCSTADLGHTIGLDAYKYLIGLPYVWPAMGNFGGPFYLSGCTNANPTTCTMVTGSINASKPCIGTSAATQIPGCTFNVLFLNQSTITNGSYQPDLTGTNWSTLNTCVTTTFDPTCIMGNGNNGSATTNGAMLATMVDDKHFTLPIDTTTWGPITAVVSGFPYVFFDFTPMGSNFRLSTSLLNTSVCSGSSYCDYDYVILNTLRNYGFTLIDAVALSNPGWVMRTDNSEFVTLDMSLAQQAMHNYFNANALDANLDVVNTASIIANKTARCSPQAPPTCPNDATSTVGQITVTATNSIDSASIDVIPEGTAVGVNPEALSMVGGTTFQLMPWVSGNTTTTVTYSCCTSVDGVLPVITGVSVNSTGLITAPTSAQITTYLGANSNVMPQAILTISSVGDSNAKAYVHLDFWPADGSGAVRMMSAGNYQSSSSTWSPIYNDGTNIWPGGQFTSIPALLSGIAYPLLGVNSAVTLNIAAKILSWAGCVPAPCSDAGNLYWNAMEAVSTGDIMRMLVLPSGQYRVTIYNSPPYTNLNYGKLGTTLFDWELQGTRVASYVDGWAQTGATGNATGLSDAHFFTGYKMTGIASVAALNGANGFLTQALRGRSTAVPYGITTSGLLIEPVSGSLTVQQAVLPMGLPKTAYSSMVQAYGGTAPYTYMVSAGTLPTGLSLGTDGTVSGIPTTIGTSTFTVQATDNVSATATKSVTLTIVGPVAPASQTLDGVKLQGSKL